MQVTVDPLRHVRGAAQQLDIAKGALARRQAQIPAQPLGHGLGRHAAEIAELLDRGVMVLGRQGQGEELQRLPDQWIAFAFEDLGDACQQDRAQLGDRLAIVAILKGAAQHLVHRRIPAGDLVIRMDHEVDLPGLAGHLQPVEDDLQQGLDGPLLRVVTRAPQHRQGDRLKALSAEFQGRQGRKGRLYRLTEGSDGRGAVFKIGRPWQAQHEQVLEGCPGGRGQAIDARSGLVPDLFLLELEGRVPGQGDDQPGLVQPQIPVTYFERVQDRTCRPPARVGRDDQQIRSLGADIAMHQPELPEAMGGFDGKGVHDAVFIHF